MTDPTIPPMKPLFQLSAKGDSVNGWPFKMRSKRVFVSKGAAEAYIPEFIDKCCDKAQVEAAYREGLKVSISELECAADDRAEHMLETLCKVQGADFLDYGDRVVEVNKELVAALYDLLASIETQAQEPGR